MPDVESLRFVIRHCNGVQQRLNCALPIFRSLKPQAVSLVTSSRRIQELSID